MQSFQLILLSRIHYILFLVTGFLIFMLSSIFLIPDDVEKETWLVIFLLFFVLAIVGVDWAARKLSTQVVALTVYADYLDIQWIKRPLFSLKKNRQVSWNDMDSFIYEKFRYDYQLKIVIKNGDTIRFLEDIGSVENNQQLYNFYCLLKDKSAAFAVAFRKEQRQVPLREGTPFFRTKLGMILSFFLVIVMIVGFILMPIIDDNEARLREWKSALIFIVVMIVAGMLFHLFLRKKIPVKRVRKKNRKTAPKKPS